MLTHSGLLSSTVLRQFTGQIPYPLTRKSSKTKLAPTKKSSRKGSKSKYDRDIPINYDPAYLVTNVFKNPQYVTTTNFRELRKREKRGGNDGKNEYYKNPGYYSYQRFSYYDLMMAMNSVKQYIKCVI